MEKIKDINIKDININLRKEELEKLFDEHKDTLEKNVNSMMKEIIKNKQPFIFISKSNILCLTDEIDLVTMIAYLLDKSELTLEKILAMFMSFSNSFERKKED